MCMNGSGSGGGRTGNKGTHAWVRAINANNSNSFFIVVCFKWPQAANVSEARDVPARAVAEPDARAPYCTSAP